MRCFVVPLVPVSTWTASVPKHEDDCSLGHGFDPKPLIDAREPSISVAASDFDLDGDQDFVAQFADPLRITRSRHFDGIGHFLPAHGIKTALAISLVVAVVDVGGDGDSDVMPASGNVGFPTVLVIYAVRIWFGNKTPYFVISHSCGKQGARRYRDELDLNRKLWK
jgi:hypothetical protein